MVFAQKKFFPKKEKIKISKKVFSQKRYFETLLPPPLLPKKEKCPKNIFPKK